MKEINIYIKVKNTKKPFWHKMFSTYRIKGQNNKALISEAYDSLKNEIIHVSRDLSILKFSKKDLKIIDKISLKY